MLLLTAIDLLTVRVCYATHLQPTRKTRKQSINKLSEQGDSSMLNGLTAFLKYLQSERHHRTPQAKEALSHLLAALRETTNYLDYHYNAGNRSQEKEFELCRMWEESALSLRQFDRDLARRCLLKGRLWAGGGEVIEINENRLRIDELRSDFDKLFDTIN